MQLFCCAEAFFPKAVTAPFSRKDRYSHTFAREKPASDFRSGLQAFHFQTAFSQKQASMQALVWLAGWKKFPNARFCCFSWFAFF
jgi:hypothetical protein